MFENELDFSALMGQTLTSIEGKKGDDEIKFVSSTGKKYRLLHWNDCCEYVTVEEIIGDLDDIVGSPILLAEEVTSCNETPEGITPPENPESYTWTFYKLSTIKGSVTIRWLGESNGYYSEGVTFEGGIQ